MVDLTPSPARRAPVPWTEMPPLPQSRARSFGRYQLRELLGQGAVGDVYRAFDTVTRREVALKVLTDHAANHPVHRRRFEREALSAAALNDPHIVPIFDFGSVGSRRYLAMQLVTGVDLYQLLGRQGSLSPEMSVKIVEQISSALDTAHAANVVHRDVKPSNILLTHRDFAYLIDFGIARGADASTLTGTGNTVGTLAYMAPEQFHGRASASSDIYALTCVLFECLTGCRPFPGTTLQSQFTSHLHSPPPKPSVARPGIPASFDAVIARGMAKNESDRFATAHDLASAARRAMTPPISRREAPMPRREAPTPRPMPVAAPMPRPAAVSAPVRPARPVQPVGGIAQAMPVGPGIPARRHPTPQARRRSAARISLVRIILATIVLSVIAAIAYGAHLSTAALSWQSATHEVGQLSTHDGQTTDSTARSLPV